MLGKDFPILPGSDRLFVAPGLGTSGRTDPAQLASRLASRALRGPSRPVGVQIWMCSAYAREATGP
jgi:hypothetical protein